MEGAALDQVARDFGADFAKRLAGLPAGRWLGPVSSTYGSHLVLIEERSAAQLPPLDNVRRDVMREWENDRRVKAREERYRALRERYDVTIERDKAG